MKKFVIILFVLVILAAVGYAIWKSSGSYSNQPASTGNSSNSTQQNTGQAQATGTINITNNMFTPPQINVAVDGTVTWTNNDTVAHTITDDLKDVGGPDSGDIAPGKTYSHTFTKAGSYQYHCEIHPSMRGTIVVK